MDTLHHVITALVMLNIGTLCILGYFILMLCKSTTAFITAMKLEREGFVRVLALMEDIAIVEGETLPELFQRIIRVRVWRQKGIGGLPPTEGGSHEDQIHRGV